MILRTLISLNILFMMALVLASCSGTKKRAGISSDDGGLKLKMVKEEFPNGLKVILVENKQLPIFSYYTFYNVGSKFERPGITGVSHFLEHMMFKGSKKYPQGVMDRMIEGSGGSTNAYTTRDMTVYYEHLPSKMINNIIDVEADRLVNLVLDGPSFESEKKVILEEKKMRYENRPHGQLYYHLFANIFEKTPYGRSVIGEDTDIINVTKEQMTNYYRTFYSPNNAIIVIAGDININQVLIKIKEKFGDIAASDKYREYKAKYEEEHLFRHKGRYGRKIEIRGQSPNPLFSMAFPGVKLGTQRAYVLDILSTVLGEGQSSYLHQKFVAGRRPSLSDISVSNYNLKHNGVFFISGSLLKGVSLKRFRKKLKKETKKLCETAITERSLEKTKNQYLVDYYGELQTNEGIASFLGSLEAYLGDYTLYKDQLDIYNKITVEQVKEACHDIFKQKNLFISVWDKHKKTKGSL